MQGIERVHLTIAARVANLYYGERAEAAAIKDFSTQYDAIASGGIAPPLPTVMCSIATELQARLLKPSIQKTRALDVSK